MTKNENIQVIDNLWILPLENKQYKIGLTAEAQEELGNITYAMLPEVGQKLIKGEAFVEMEAEKAVSEFVAPMNGIILSVNETARKHPAVLDDPEPLNAWLVIISKI